MRIKSYKSINYECNDIDGFAKGYGDLRVKIEYAISRISIKIDNIMKIHFPGNK